MNACSFQFYFTTLHCERSFMFIGGRIMKYNKEDIIKQAFDVFMEKGFDSTSISVLQKELNMSRGAMYRYFTNKDELFRCVIDAYFFKMFDKALKYQNPNLKLSELIEYAYRRQKVILAAFSRAGYTHITFLNYTALMIQAAKHYPGFVARFKEVHTTFYDSWVSAVKCSVEHNEIRKDIDVDIVSKMFNNISFQESSEHCCDGCGFENKLTEDLKNRKLMMDYMFNLIKV